MNKPSKISEIFRTAELTDCGKIRETLLQAEAFVDDLKRMVILSNSPDSDWFNRNLTILQNILLEGMKKSYDLP